MRYRKTERQHWSAANFYQWFLLRKRKEAPVGTIEKVKEKVFSCPQFCEGVDEGGKPCARESRTRLDADKIDNLYGKFSTCDLGMWVKPHALPLCRMNV